MDYYHRSIERFLRSPPSNLARSAYATEVNPWVTRGDVEAALFFRGTIVSALGSIETSLGELALRCSRLEHYAALRSTFPYSFKNRIKFLRQAFSQEPLLRHQEIANQFFDRVERLFAARNMVAHARMQVMPDWGVTFHHFPESFDGGVSTSKERLTLQDLELLAWRGARLSRLYQRLANILDDEDLLPALEI